VTFFSNITRPLVIAGCVYNPQPPISAKTNAAGILPPTRLAQGLPLSVTLATGGGTAASAYVPYQSSSTFADFIAQANLSSRHPLNGVTLATGPVDFNDQDGLHVLRIDLVPTLFSSLPSPQLGVVVFCSDCTPAPICSGASGTGTLAIGNGAVWECQR
jgi:hypothetical protein